MNNPAPKNEAYGDFGLRRARGVSSRDLAFAVAFSIGVLAVGSVLTTQWLARSLGFQPALGEPPFLLRGAPCYAPWSSWNWSAELEAHPGAQGLVRGAELGQYGSLILAWLGGIGLLARARRRANNRADELHGSARLAERRDIERAGLLSKEGVIVGSWQDRRARLTRYLRHDGPEHILMLAPTGSGKGVGPVLSTLLAWMHSTIVLDPKGENFALTSGYRASLGHKVFKLDFAAKPENTAAFNPLDAVRVGEESEVADAQRLARMIVDPDGKQFEGPNKHWAETGSALLTGAILHVLYERKLSGETASLRDVLDALTDPERSHIQVLHHWQTFAHDPQQRQGWRATQGPTCTHPVVAATAREQLNREERERGAVLSSAVTPLSLYRDELLSLNTSWSDFSIKDLMDAEVPVTVYLVLRPSDIHRLRSVVRIFLDLCLRRLVETMSFADGQSVASHKHRLLLLLDEFPVLGKLDVFAESLAYIRGWGIKAFLITQDYEQLRAAYGDRETISSNCHIKTAFAPTKPETAKWLSSMLGNTTVLRHSRQRSLSVGAFASQRSSESEQEIGRPLLTPDECMRLPGARKEGTQIVEAGDMLIFAAGHPPIYGTQPLYFEDPVLLARARISEAPPRPDAEVGAVSASQVRRASVGPAAAQPVNGGPEHGAQAPEPSEPRPARAGEVSPRATDSSAQPAPKPLPPPAGPSLQAKRTQKAAATGMSATSSAATKLSALKADPMFAALMSDAASDDANLDGSELA